MNLDRALQLNTAALAIMGAVFLGLGHESIVLPLALAIAAVSSATLTNVFRWLRLNRIIANLVALAAVVWSLRNFLDVNRVDQLLAIADMLVYLQIVLLFQEKTARVYWQLIVLSLLQVVVAAALNLGPQFGALLSVYMALAMSALVLLCLYREWRRPAADAKTPLVGPAPAWRSLLAGPQVAAASGRQDVEAAARPTLVARQVALLGAATLVFAAVFFYATPRLGEGAWSGTRGGMHAVTGFSPEVQLEEFGRIHQSNQLVMRVSLSNVVDRQPHVMISDPYFNGVALSDYQHDGSAGRWTPSALRRTASAIRRRQQIAATSATSSKLVRQDYILEGSTGSLFVIVPMHRLPETPPELWFAPMSYRLVRRPETEEQVPLREIRYSVATTSLDNGRQVHGVPHVNPLQTPEDRFALEQERAGLLMFDETRFPALTAVATQVVHDQELEDAGALDRALALERHFRAPGNYQYSLSLSFVRDSRLDPVEDFVANHRTGHCEYFASALVLMLRSQGIPARMIAGYKGGDFNSIGDYYQVREKHAHAWVEALIPSGQTPEWEIAGSEGPAGTWYRLDPTPPSSFATAVGGEGVAERVGEAFDYVELLWRDYVLSLNADKQQDSIYEPVSSRALGSLPGWMESRSVQRMARRMARQLGLEIEVSTPRDPAAQVFDWRTGTIVVVLVLFAIVALQAIVLLYQLVRRRRASSLAAGPDRRKRAPRFYRRLESLLGRLHLRRAAGQTARELAAAAGERLERTQPQAGAGELPAQIVAAYYRVRFGGAALDSQEQAAIEQALDELTPAVHAVLQARS
jgi:protein-glutamine gamma-glutamyltransferase